MAHVRASFASGFVAREGQLNKRSRDRGVLAGFHNWKQRRVALVRNHIDYFVGSSERLKGTVALDARSKVRAGVWLRQQTAMAGVLAMKKTFSRLGSLWANRSVSLMGNTLVVQELGGEKQLLEVRVHGVEVLDEDRGANKKPRRFDVRCSSGALQC